MMYELAARAWSSTGGRAVQRGVWHPLGPGQIWGAGEACSLCEFLTAAARKSSRFRVPSAASSAARTARDAGPLPGCWVSRFVCAGHQWPGPRRQRLVLCTTALQRSWPDAHQTSRWVDTQTERLLTQAQLSEGQQELLFRQHMHLSCGRHAPQHSCVQGSPSPLWPWAPWSPSWRSTSCCPSPSAGRAFSRARCVHCSLGLLGCSCCPRADSCTRAGDQLAAGPHRVLHHQPGPGPAAHSAHIRPGSPSQVQGAGPALHPLSSRLPSPATAVPGRAVAQLGLVDSSAEDTCACSPALGRA